MIRKGQYTENYTVLPNDLTQNRNLSFEAKGMLGYLLSKPNNWVVRETDLCKEGGCGTHKVRRIKNELIAAKYIIKARPRNEDGTFSPVDFEVFPEPQTSIVQKPTVDDPTAETSPTTKERLSKNTDCRKPPDQKISEKKNSRRRTRLEKDTKPNKGKTVFAAELGLSEKQFESQWQQFRDYQISKGNTSCDWDAAWRNWLLKAIEQFGLIPEYAEQMKQRRKTEAVVDFIIERRSNGDGKKEIVRQVFDTWRFAGDHEVIKCFDLADQKQAANSAT